MFLFIIISAFFIFLKSTLLYYSNLNINHCLIEFISTLFSVLFLLLIISPALIILLDFDLIILPSFIIYSLGLQWAWQFNISFLPFNIGFSSYCDHYIISTINKRLIINCNNYKNRINRIINIKCNKYYSCMGNLKRNNNINNIKSNIINKSWFTRFFSAIKANSLVIDYQLYMLFKQLYFWLNRFFINSPLIRSSTNKKIEIKTRYLFEISQYLLLPIYSFIRLFVYSFDVIHTLGFYSWAIKIDAIPGRINLANTLRLLLKGEYRGRCFELCGQGHLTMLISSLVIFLVFDF